MGKYTDLQVELENGEEITIERTPNYEEGGTSHSTEDCPYGFDSVEELVEHLNNKD